MLVERECPQHGYGLAGDGCPICRQELSLKRKELELREREIELKEKEE